MPKLKNGNILESDANIICHQVNCQGVMGAGLALQIRKRYPSAFEEYRGTCTKAAGNRQDLMGTIQLSPVGQRKLIAHCFGQFGYGRYGCHTDYDALREAMTRVCAFAKETSMSIAIPYGIGCGLAGGNWLTVKRILSEVFADSNVDVTIYALQQS